MVSNPPGNKLQQQDSYRVANKIVQLRNIEGKKLARLEKIPSYVVGTLRKETSIFKYLTERYIALDGPNGQLIRYKSKVDMPNKPRAILNMTDIKEIRVLPNKTSMLRNDVYFFEIEHKEGLDVYAASSETNRQAWINLIEDTLDYWRVSSTVPQWFYHVQRSGFLDRTEQSEQQQGFIVDLDVIQTHTDTKQPSVIQPATPSLFRPHATPDNSRNVKLRDFEVLKLLGEGSFGVVFQVRHKTNNQTFAMKVLSKKTLFLRKMKKYAMTEASILRKANHPLVLRMHYAFQTPTSLYMICDCGSPKNLEMLIAEKDRFTHQEVLFYMAEITAGLEYLHSCGVLYRDLKPDNIMIGLDGHVMLVDFGLSKEGVAKGEYAKSKVGSPLYFAPEIVRNKGATQVSDIFALGILFFRLLFKQDPYDGTTDIFVLNDKILNEEIQPIYEISPEAEDLLKSLTKKDPKARLGYKSFSEIKHHAYFSDIDWQKVGSKGLDLPRGVEKQLKSRRFGGSSNQGFDSQMLDDLDYTDDNHNFLRVSHWSFDRDINNNDPESSKL
jgi:serine/threonine protein kinase